MTRPTRPRRHALLAACVAALAAVAAAFAACHVVPTTESPMPTTRRDIGDPDGRHAVATFGGGCFWCTEAVFRELDGVIAVTSGYAGGTTSDPTYEEVCTGTTGHAEVIQVRYDPSKVDYAKILEVFFATHDPTTLNRQGADTGTQYRSVVFAHDDEQRRVAEEVKRALDASGAYDAPVVTEIVPAGDFWPAEEYHQGYYAANPSQGYCRAVIRPKLEKFRKAFADRLKR
jgi:peptide-methionine (S)-S-oxide reductase